MNQHIFPGGNTSRGFVNFFDGIVAPWEENRRTYVLKGGPGVGKNTLMRAVGDKAQEQGMDIVYFHCASDRDSLDAIRIPQMGITMLDGTSPHVIDPVTPGAVDGILNLGIYLDEKKLEQGRGVIEKLSAENKQGYVRTFAYLAAAGSLQKNTDDMTQLSLDKKGLRQAAYEVMGERRETSHTARVRKLFASAITPQGYTNYINTIVKDERVVVLSGAPVACSYLIELMLGFAVYAGYDCEVYYAPLLPDKPEHLIVKDLNLCVTVDPTEDGEILDLSALTGKEYQETLVFNSQQKQILLDAAIRSLQGSKAIHDDMEAYYRTAMDFDALNEFTQQFISELF